MRAYLKKPDAVSIIRRLCGLYAIAVVCIPLFITGIVISFGHNSTVIGRVVESAADANDTDGPNVLLSYDNPDARKNPTSSFVYFVPLISPTLVDMEISADNQQQTGFVSYEKKVTSKSFYVACEFEMQGKGFFKTIFSAPEVIAIVLGDTEKGEPMTNALDYIKFEGEGLGCIEVWGTINGSTETVTEVDIHFNARGRKSPVTIGLYNIHPKDGQYKYENRYNELIARVATLTFKKCDGEPRMGIKLVSVNKATKPNGFMGRVKGTVANFFLQPPVVSKLGNETMLNFGYALLKEKPAFTFPKAKNLRQSSTVAVIANK